MYRWPGPVPVMCIHSKVILLAHHLHYYGHSILITILWTTGHFCEMRAYIYYDPKNNMSDFFWFFFNQLTEPKVLKVKCFVKWGEHNTAAKNLHVVHHTLQLEVGMVYVHNWYMLEGQLLMSDLMWAEHLLHDPLQSSV